jgi:hypothetical protein
VQGRRKAKNFAHTDSTRLEMPPPPDVRYIPHLASRQSATLIEPVAAYNTQHRVTFDYESIGRRKYRTTIELNHRVITSFHFHEIDLNPTKIGIN